MMIMTMYLHICEELKLCENPIFWKKNIDLLVIIVLISKWLQSDKKIKTLTDTAELIEDAVSPTITPK